MKKLVNIILLAIAIFSLVACGQKENNQNIEKNIVENKKEFDYIKTENINNYKMVQTLELPENNAMGYVWNYEIKNPDVIVSVNNVFEKNITDDTSVGKRILSFQGIKEGKTEVELKYENTINGELPVETLRYVFEVDNQNRIAIIDQIK